MEEKEQTPPVQVPTEANNYKHIDTPSEGGTDDMDDKSGEDHLPKNDADSGDDDSPEAILQEEKIIDPGNEHHHQAGETSEDSTSRNDTDTGGDDKNITESEPGKGKNDETDTSGKAG